MRVMRAIYVLVAILSFATPQVSWGALEQSLSSSGGIVLASPAASTAQLSRAVVKTDKTFSTTFAIPPAVALLQPHSCGIDYHAVAPADPPNLSLDTPPLAPRPPPV
jgi:hypothetical protein